MVYRQLIALIAILSSTFFVLAQEHDIFDRPKATLMTEPCNLLMRSILFTDGSKQEDVVCALNGEDLPDGSSSMVVTIEGIEFSEELIGKASENAFVFFAEDAIIDYDEFKMLVQETSIMEVERRVLTSHHGYEAAKTHSEEQSGESGGLRKLAAFKKSSIIYPEQDIMVVRVATRTTKSIDTPQTLTQAWFGRDYSVKAQYSRCTSGQLNFPPAARQTDINGRVAAGGVYSLVTRDTLPYYDDVGFNAIYTAEAYVRHQMSTKFNFTNEHYERDPVSNSWQHKTCAGPFCKVAACIPSDHFHPGIAGMAYLNHWFSWYNDRYCSHTSTLMHEIAHNMGLGHAGKGSYEYGDATGVMGVGGENAVARCFNAAKTWQLGFLNQYHETISVDGSGWNRNWGWHARLYGFYRLFKAPVNVKSILRIEPPARDTEPESVLYVSFNHSYRGQTSPNKHAPDPNKVLILETHPEGNAEHYSWQLAALDKGERFIVEDFANSGYDVKFYVSNNNPNINQAWAAVQVIFTARA